MKLRVYKVKGDCLMGRPWCSAVRSKNGGDWDRTFYRTWWEAVHNGQRALCESRHERLIIPWPEAGLEADLLWR